MDERLGRFHYDLVATSTFHADETIAIVEGRAPVVALLASPSYTELLNKIRALPEGSVVGLVCSNRRSTANIAEWIAESGAPDVSLVTALLGDDAAMAVADRRADLLLLTREALKIGLAERFGRPESKSANGHMTWIRPAWSFSGSPWSGSGRLVAPRR